MTVALGILTTTNPDIALARAAEKLGVPVPPSVYFDIGRYRLRHVPGGVEILNAGEGGHFDVNELAAAIGRFLSERL